MADFAKHAVQRSEHSSLRTSSVTLSQLVVVFKTRSWANGKMIRHGQVLLGEDKRTDHLAGITRNLIDLEIANNHRMV